VVNKALFSYRLAVERLDLPVPLGANTYALVGEPQRPAKTTTLSMVAACSARCGSVEIFGIAALSDPVAAIAVLWHVISTIRLL